MSGEAQALYFQALRKHRDRDYPGAVALLEQALERDPQHCDAWEALGVVYEKMERLDDAIRAMEKLAEINPDEVMAHTNLSRFYMKKGWKEKAEEAQGRARLLGWNRGIDDRGYVVKHVCHPDAWLHLRTVEQHGSREPDVARQRGPLRKAATALRECDGLHASLYQRGVERRVVWRGRNMLHRAPRIVEQLHDRDRCRSHPEQSVRGLARETGSCSPLIDHRKIIAIDARSQRVEQRRD